MVEGGVALVDRNNGRPELFSTQEYSVHEDVLFPVAGEVFGVELGDVAAVHEASDASTAFRSNSDRAYGLVDLGVQGAFSVF